jgi:S1-C subfamily serine protease
MRFTINLLKIAVAGMVLMAAAAVGVVVAPAMLHGQTVRERPFGEIRTHILGGSQIGASLRDVDEADVTREKLTGTAGAVVEEVDRDSPAADAGFRAGDVVLTFDGEKVRSARHLARLIEESPDGRAVSATIVRGSKPMDLKVTPEASRAFSSFQNGLRDLEFAWPNAFRSAPFSDWRELRPEGAEPRIFTPEQPFMYRRGQLGVTVQSLSGQLAEYFGAASGGALIASVTPDSPAADAGLKAGDVITKINDRQVRDSDDVTRFLRADTVDVTITILRDRKEQTVKATLDPIEARTPRRIIR